MLKGIVLATIVIMAAVVGITALVVPPAYHYGIADQVERVLPSVVHISHSSGWQGSGCIISEDGLIFTAKHITDGGGVFTVTLNDGTEYETDLCVEDSKYDVAFLKISLPDGVVPSYNRLADISRSRVGDGVFIVGSPFGFDNFNSVSFGILSAAQRGLDYGYGWQVTFQIDAMANPGNSGGPVFNMAGEVIGVFVAGVSECVNYSVPVAVFADDIETVRMMFNASRFKVREYGSEI